MGYQIELSDDGKYIRIRISGEMTVELAHEFSAKLQEMSRQTGVKRFLFDSRGAQNASSMLENYSFAYRDSEALGLERNVRSAILVSHGDKSHNFIEITMRNAGFNVRLFTSEAMAVEWLEANGD